TCEGAGKTDVFFGSVDGAAEMLCCKLSSRHLHVLIVWISVFLLFGGPSHEAAKRQSLVDRRSISGLRSSFSRLAALGSTNRTVARFTNRSSNVFCRLMSALLSSGSKVTSMSRALFMPAGVIMPVFE